jgi:hypothetical protein
MRDNLTTPLALIFAAVLLLAISFIPPRAAEIEPAPATPDLMQWVLSVPVEREDHRLALVLAVHASAWALDRVLAETRSAPEATASLALPTTAARRGQRPTRPMMPFYSFASPRPQES